MLYNYSDKTKIHKKRKGSTMRNKQLTIADIYSDLEVFFEDDKPKFLTLLEKHLEIENFIPNSFYYAYYRKLGRKRAHPLSAFICAFLIQNLFQIPTVELLRIFLKTSKELREFCGFISVPDSSKFTRFKQSFSSELQEMFDHLVNITNPICNDIDSELSKILVYDTTGIETFVAENNPKFINSKIRQIKNNNKELDKSSIYNIAYGTMPKYSPSDADSKLMYINGHFCYAHKFGILTNGLGIVRDIRPLTHLYNDSTPENEKSISDSKSFKTFMDVFFLKNHQQYSTFLGDSAFDSHEIYHYLLSDRKFKKALIPMQQRNTHLPQPGFDENGIPLCPNDSDLKLIKVGVSGENGRRLRIKFCCPKSVHKNHSRICTCENPCSKSSYGRTVHVYPEKNWRLYPGIIRESDEWVRTYKIRTVIERTISHLKGNSSLTEIMTRNSTTIYSDMLLAGMSQLLTVILANAISQQQLFRSVKELIC